MFLTVIPAKNEAKSLGKVISNLPKNLLDLVVPILNGCTDNSLDILEKTNCPIVAPLWFNEPLGIDIPRAVGAAEAKLLDADGILFMDGDMYGAQAEMLMDLILAVREDRLDLALTNCYPNQTIKNISTTAACLLEVRRSLNTHLKIIDSIGACTPSHGPHAVSGRLLRLADPIDFAVPPLLLARAARAGLRIGVTAQIPHTHLGSPLRSPVHSSKIIETIIGDCLCALHTQNGTPGGRMLNGREYVGYHEERRWDLLQAFINGHITGALP